MHNIRAVSSRCIAHQCVDLEFLTMIGNWASALTEGSEEVAAALSEAGYSAEQHTINFDLSLHGVNGMSSLPVVVRYLVQKHPKLIDHHLFADELSRLGRALRTSGYGPLEFERGFTIYGKSGHNCFRSASSWLFPTRRPLHHHGSNYSNLTQPKFPKGSYKEGKSPFFREI